MVDVHRQPRLVADTNNLEEAQATFSALVSPVMVDQLDRRSQFRWRSMMVELGPVAVATQEYGAAFAAASKGGGGDVYTMSFPTTPVSGDVTSGGRSHSVARARSTYVYSASAVARFRYDSHYRGIQLTIGAQELTATLSALLGGTTGVPCRFDPHLSLERGVGPALERAVTFFATESAFDDGLLDSAVASQRFGEALIVRLLEGQPHNYSERLAKIADPASPRSVRLAAEYLEANLMRPVRISDLASVAGVSVRALQVGFRKHRGCTPAEFLRDRRLTLARVRLLEGGASITEVARECGFAHLGRFSARYRARFGERPLDTRARAK